MLTTTRERIGAATGATFVALIFIGNVMATAGNATSEHPTGEQVLADAADTAASTTAQLGLVLEVLGFVAFIVFLGYLYELSSRQTSGRPYGLEVGTAIVAGVTMLAIKLGSVGPMIALAVGRKGLDPDLARILNDLNSAAFILSWLPFAVFVAAAAAALHRAGLVGRPSAYIGTFLGVAGLVLALAGLTDPLDAIPVAFLLSMLWLTVVSIRLAVRPGRIADPAPTTADDEVGAAVRA